MKKIAVCFICLTVMAVTVKAQSVNNLFEKYSEDNRFEYVSVGKSMMNMVKMYLSTDNEDEVTFIRGVKILTLNDTTIFIRNVLKELNQALEKGKYETVVEVRDKGNRVKMYSKENKKEDSEMLIVNQDSLSLNMIWIRGKLNAHELSKMISVKTLESNEN